MCSLSGYSGINGTKGVVRRPDIWQILSWLGCENSMKNLADVSSACSPPEPGSVLTAVLRNDPSYGTFAGLFDRCAAKRPLTHDDRQQHRNHDRIHQQTEDAVHADEPTHRARDDHRVGGTEGRRTPDR